MLHITSRQEIEDKRMPFYELDFVPMKLVNVIELKLEFE